MRTVDITIGHGQDAYDRVVDVVGRNRRMKATRKFHSADWAAAAALYLNIPELPEWLNQNAPGHICGCGTIVFKTEEEAALFALRWL